MQSKKRFIAGAICPKCQAMDTIQIVIDSNKTTQQCIKCQFQASHSDNPDNLIQVKKIET